ncbi:MAG: hypothetical protein HUJ56_10550, partial [Erysipelotrichaceae bacterium]|nr:hypothetical protein [Erysipelotrichaceae bacterium]
MFRLYFAGGDISIDEYLKERNALRLFSYANEPNLLKKWLDGEHDSQLFVDSGAYSVYNNDATISIKNYADYLNENKGIKLCASLDVLDGTEEESYNNYIFLKHNVRNDITILPVFHRGDDYKYLKKYIKQTDYIGIGT